MTATQLCKAILQLRQQAPDTKLPADQAEKHESIENLVGLYWEGLVRPTDAAVPLLTALYRALDKVREDNVLVTLEFANAYVAGKVGDEFRVVEWDGVLWLVKPSDDKDMVGITSFGPKVSNIARFKAEVAKYNEPKPHTDPKANFDHAVASWAAQNTVTPPVTKVRADEPLPSDD